MSDGTAITGEGLRERQRDAWGAAAHGWLLDPDAPAGPVDPISERLIALARIVPGQRVLDLSCGGGNPAFAIAAHVGPTGYVLGLDVAAPMIEGARAYAARRDVANAEFRLIERETDLGVPRGSFDAAVCRCGLMFMSEPAAALRAMGAAVAPGGRIVVSTWAAPERCPSFMVQLDAVRRNVDLSPEALAELTRPYTTVPTREALLDLFAAGGLRGDTVEEVTAYRTAESAEAYWEWFAEWTAPLRLTLASLPAAVTAAIRDDMLAALRSQFPEGPVRLAGVALVGVAVNAA